MIKNNDFSRLVSIQQHKGGYVIQACELGQGDPEIVLTFEEAVNVIARKFSLLLIGEKIEFKSPTPEGEKEGE